MSNLLIISFIVFASFVLTELVRRYTLKKKLIDIPNERSSHTVPTPRGGGLSIVIIFLTSIIVVDVLATDIFISLVGSGAIIAGIGYWDDHVHIPAKLRLIAHFLSSAWALYWLGGIVQLHIFNYSINPGFVGIVVVSFLLVWLLNLFNFMDGIDGIAASETIFVSCAGAYFTWLYGLESLAITSLILAASTVGFLFLNWPPARIFMGDVGSGFLGITLGIIVYGSILNDVPVWIWIILLSVFLVDSGVTLIRRIYYGEKWHEAHCSHAYQHAARKWGHKKTTISVIIIDLFWLLPLAIVSYLIPDISILITLLALTPLIIVALKLKAGITIK